MRLRWWRVLGLRAPLGWVVDSCTLERDITAADLLTVQFRRVQDVKLSRMWAALTWGPR